VATVLDLVTASLQHLGVLQAGETPSSEDAAFALSRLNELLDQWATERLTIYQITRTTWTITSGDGSYTVGAGGDVNVARPIYLDHVNYIQDTTATTPLELQLQPLDPDAYSKIPQKTLTAVYPTCWYYNPTYPLGTLELWPVPTSAVLQGVLYHPTAVTQFAAIATTVTLPPGYFRCLVTNLGVEMAPAFGAPLNPVLIQAASDSKAAIKRANTRLMDLSVDAGALIQGRNRTFFYSIISGP
jgi:hypothetical protein